MLGISSSQPPPNRYPSESLARIQPDLGLVQWSSVAEPRREWKDFALVPGVRRGESVLLGVDGGVEHADQLGFPGFQSTGTGHVQGHDVESEPRLVVQLGVEFVTTLSHARVVCFHAIQKAHCLADVAVLVALWCQHQVHARSLHPARIGEPSWGSLQHSGSKTFVAPFARGRHSQKVHNGREFQKAQESGVPGKLVQSSHGHVNHHVNHRVHGRQYDFLVIRCQAGVFNVHVGVARARTGFGV